MKIGLDAKRIFHNHSGLGNYGRSTLQILAKDQKDTDFFLYSPKVKIHEEVVFVKKIKNVFTKPQKSFNPMYPQLFFIFAKKCIH